MNDMGPQVPEEECPPPGVAPPPTAQAQVQAGAARGDRSTHPWLQGLYSFPFYATSLGAWTWLTLGFVLFGLCCGLFLGSYAKGE